MVLHVPVSRKWRICSLAGPGTFMPVHPVAGLQQLHVEPWLSRTCLSSERVTLQLRDNSFQTLGNKCSSRTPWKPRVDKAGFHTWNLCGQPLPPWTHGISEVWPQFGTPRDSWVPFLSGHDHQRCVPCVRLENTSRTGNSSLTRGGFGSAEPVCPCRQDWSSLKVFGTSKARLGTLRQQAGRAEDVRTAGAFGVSDPSPFTGTPAGGLGPLVDTSLMSFLNDLYSRCSRRWPLLRKRGRARGRGPHLRICRAGVGTWGPLATGSFANLDVCNGGFPSQTNKTKEHGLCTLRGFFRALCGPAWAAQNPSIWLHDGDVGWSLATLTPSSPVSSALGVPEPVAGLVDVFVWEELTRE
ncbi:uncharacterized protein LOC131807412 isoform X2 [Mustela lutreola]|uniref:uncharacterized protein LOC131807412 isoform X2 n=1 Tax=Mustela lutreola TaxID=9666 RepID=UPI0027973517|nr:uncharacterized protein LOC131807412 isoform X2 [Mustela lutreola]XP_058988702.1 uncharacterized protein LOC131807412 isoform X2 [Mustela lutreola]